MPNMMDYLAWRGDLDVRADGFNAVDALALANFCYNDLTDGVRTGKMRLDAMAAQLPPLQASAGRFVRKWRALLEAMAGSRRFGGAVLHDYIDVTDPERGIQFAAVTADLADGSSFICFRGTDGSVVGWREDFNMAFEHPVPAQTAAVRYLEMIAGKTAAPLRAGGHSKGGNLALYAAVHASEAVQERLERIYSFDGPGLDDESMASSGYGRIRAAVESYIPRSSVVGLLLAYHPDYRIVQSDGSGLLQHDSFTWQVLGAGFVEAQDVSSVSRVVDESLHSWLKDSPPPERRLLVNTLFDFLESTDAQELSDLLRNPRESAAALLGAARNLDLQSAAKIAGMLSRLVKIGAENIRALHESGGREQKKAPD